jgi:hypothetical protein
MNPRLVPIYFEPGRDEGFDRQLEALQGLFSEEAEFLAPIALGTPLPPEADAAVFPQLLGEGYRRVADFQAIQVPILIITSEFGSYSMWDWELMAYLRENGVPTLAPCNIARTQKLLSALGVRRELKQTKFLVYQDNPGQGQQAPIFKRFYWWEDEATQRMVQKFGITIEKRSYRELGARAMELPDSAAEAARKGWDVPTADLSKGALDAATKLYLVVRRDLDADKNIRAVGMNCLNESHFSNTTPCLAYNRLYIEDGFIWGCEGDTVSMLTKYILHRSLKMPILMTNLYPFLLGNAALRHERMEKFPEIEGNPDNYILVAHCGYMGVIPQPFSTQWSLKKKVLSIVDPQASAIDARIPTGPVTFGKIHSSFNDITVAEGELEFYAQQPGSDCLNGGVIRVRDGNRLLKSLPSHHVLLMTGHQGADIADIAPIFNLKVESF